MVLTNSVPGEGSLPGLQMATLSLCGHMPFPWCIQVGGERERGVRGREGRRERVSMCVKESEKERGAPPHDQTIITSQRPQLQILSHWRLQFQHMNLSGGGGKGWKNTIHSVAGINVHLKLYLYSTRSCLLRKDKK